MTLIVVDPADAAAELSQRLEELRAWVVVLGDQQLANAFDGFATGPLRAVILAPDTQAVCGVLATRNGGSLDDAARAVAISATSGHVVDTVLAGEVVDNVRIFEAFVRAESQ